MAITKYLGKYFQVTHTVEEEGPHLTIPYDHYDETFAITIILQGKGVCYVEGNGFPLSDGDLVILSPDESRSFRFEQSGRHERLSIYFTNALLTNFCDYALPLQRLYRARPLGVGNRYTPADYPPQHFVPLFQQLCSLMAGDSPDREAWMHLLILQLLFELYSCAKTLPSQNSSQSTVITELCSYIKDHLDQDLSYTALQKRFFVSRYQLAEVFPRNTGMTLTEYIIYKRLLCVISLVRKGEGIENAAYRAGFHTYSHFYKEFKKRYNISPKKYFSNP